MGKGGSGVVWDYQSRCGDWGSTERPGCLRASQRARLQEGVGAGGSGWSQAAGFGVSWDLSGCACLRKRHLQMRGSEGHAGATGCLRALTGGMHRLDLGARSWSSLLSAV